jgi:crotonobetaine/carnitine-CoA ligase
MLTPLQVLALYVRHNDTIPDAFASRLERNGDKTFCVFNEHSRTWSEFDNAVGRLTAILLAYGLKKGDRVGIVARNHVAHVLLLLACARLSVIMVPVNPDFGQSEAEYVLHNADIGGLVVDSETKDVAIAACANKGLSPWVLQVDELEELTGAAPAAGYGNPQPDDICCIIYTSGTTGFPKGVMHSQRSFLLAGEAFVQRMHLQPDERMMIVLPMYHMNALFYSLSGAIAAGATIIVRPRFSASNFWSDAAKYQATQTNIIEAASNILRLRPRSEFDPGHQLKRLYGIRENAVKMFREEFKVPYLIGGYGMTEIPGVTCSPFDGPQKPGSMGPIGRHPDPKLPWAQCRVVDDAGNDVPDGQEGELLVKTPIVMRGYFRDPEQTAKAFTPDGWFLTGDFVKRDADGYFYFVSRKKDIIRRRGENIAGAELDRVIGEHPDVKEVAVVAVPAELGEDEILAAVVVKAGRLMEAKDIAAWCAARLAPQKVPRYVVFLSELPYTSTNKIQKAVLRADPTLKSRAVDLSLPS